MIKIDIFDKIDGVTRHAYRHFRATVAFIYRPALQHDNAKSLPLKLVTKKQLKYKNRWARKLRKPRVQVRRMPSKTVGVGGRGSVASVYL